MGPLAVTDAPTDFLSDFNALLPGVLGAALAGVTAAFLPAGDLAGVALPLRSGDLLAAAAFEVAGAAVLGLALVGEP